MTDVFPKDFVWGVAASSYQIEGAHDAAGRSPSIWDTYAATAGNIADGSNGNVACDHYHRYKEDVGLMKEIGVDAYRFSVAWPRVLPNGRGEKNGAGLDFYDRLVDELLAQGITPWATLYHWDLPQVLQDEGGWTNRNTAFAFVEFAEAVATRLGDRVKNWITHNEPWCVSVLGYAQADHAPGHTSWTEALVASHHLLLSHGLAVPVIRQACSDARVGITLNVATSEPASDSSQDRYAARQFDGELNRWFLDPLYRGHYPVDVVSEHRRVGRLPTGMDFVHAGDMEIIGAPTDFLGINYYSRAVTRSDEISEDFNLPRSVPLPDPSELTDMGWEVYPEGLTNILVRINEDYAPSSIVITENGAAYDTPPNAEGEVQDVRRCEYLKSHLQAALTARQRGVPLDGYFLWSLLDNFEWGFGYAKRFGIVWVDFETQERIIKASGYLYRDIIADSSRLGSAIG